MSVSIRNNKGFSLVELMVVVAIIGILAAIAVPNFQRFTAKSKQSEAKSNLAAIYSAERAFAAEWQSFFADFRNIGYQPTGDLHYNHGFAAAGVACPAGYNGLGAGIAAAGAAAVVFNSLNPLLCQQGGGMGGALPCRMILTPIAPGALTGTSTTPTTFVAGARGDIDGDASIDQWTINEGKQLIMRFDDVNN